MATRARSRGEITADQTSELPLRRSPLASVAESLRELSTVQRLVAAAVAWAVTVAPTAFAKSSSAWASLSALSALAAALVGPFLFVRSRRVARHVGISAFLFACVLTWLVAGDGIQPGRIDAARGAFGAVAWAAFALSWSDPWKAPKQAPEPDAPALNARSALPSLAVPLAAVGVLSALVVLGLAWRITHPERALFGHAVAVACAVALITVSAELAISRGKTRRWSSRRFGPAVMRPIALLIVLGLAGAVALVVLGR